MPPSFFSPDGFLRYSLIAGLCLALSAASLKAQSPEESPILSKDQQDARETLGQGVAAFKNAQFTEAIELFTLAKQLDPSLEKASLYLATAYASQYIPGAPSEENIRHGEMAAQEYREVLEKNPGSLSAIDGLASILYQMAGQPFKAELFEESKSFHKKHTELKPQDPQPYYSIGVIDWALAYRANMELRAEFNRSAGVGVDKNTAGTQQHGQEPEEERVSGLQDTDPLPEVIRRKYAEDYGPTIEEGIASLKHAMELKRDYDDAMVYLNLLYRRKADIVVAPSDHQDLIDKADDLLDRVKDMQQKRAETVEPHNP